MQNLPIPSLETGQRITAALTRTALPPAEEARLCRDLADYMNARYADIESVNDVAADLRVHADRLQRRTGGAL